MDEINKDIQAKMEFIVTQQAHFAANIQAHDERLTRLENIVTRLAEASFNRFEDIDARLASFSENMDRKFAALVDAQIRTDERISNLADKMAEMAEAQAHTDKRLDALIDIVREGRNGKS